MSSRFIPLTKGQQALVDDSDYNRLMQIGSWSYNKSGYAVHYYTDEFGHNRTLFMHRVVMEYALRNAPPRMQVDHINHNTLDNRSANLRLATPSQNQAHRRQRNDSDTPYKGITWNTGRWEARIKYGSQRINLGRFKNAEEAAWMYDAASHLLYAEFARCNFAEHPCRNRFDQVIAVLGDCGFDPTILSRTDAYLCSR
jgi:hypothetical protein